MASNCTHTAALAMAGPLESVVREPSRVEVYIAAAWLTMLQTQASFCWLTGEQEAALLDSEVAVTQQAVAGALAVLQPAEGFQPLKVGRQAGSIA